MTKIALETIDDVKSFVGETMRLPVDVTLRSGKFVVDGKSIMGIFSLNLAEPVTLVVESDDEAQKADVLAKLDKFIVK